MSILHSIGSIIASGLLFVASLLGSHTTAKFGDYNPTGGGTYRLQSSIGTSDSSITLSSFKEPVSAIPYTMSYLNSSIEYATLDPQTNTKEFISFSGITQNGDGSATLTGVIRGLSFSYPYTASSTFQQAHAAQSILILSNPPQLTNQYLNKANNETISGIDWFTTSPLLNDSNSTSTKQAASRQFVLDTAIQGAATSTESSMGIVQLASPAQAGAGTASSTSGAPLVLGARLATSTCQAAGYAVLVASTTTGKLDAGCIATNGNYTWTGTHVFATSTTASSTVTSFTIASSSILFNSRYAPSPLFGGTGVDGALSISSGTTTIAVGTNSVVEKNYTSISITGTGSLNFSSAATSSAGVTIILRSQGACTLTSSSMTMIDLRWLGGGLGNGFGHVGSYSSGSTGGGGGGSSGGAGINGGGTTIAGTPNYDAEGYGGRNLPALSAFSRVALPGGNGGSGDDGVIGLGAGGLYLECAGGYTFTTGGIMATGSNGTLHSGAGAGGNILVLYGSLTADTGTYTLTGGTSASGAGAGGSGAHLEAKNTSFY